MQFPAGLLREERMLRLHLHDGKTFLTGFVGLC